MKADDLVWFVQIQESEDFRAGGGGGGSKMNHCTSSPSFSPLQRQHHPRAPSGLFFFFLLQESMILKLSVARNGKLSCQGTKKLSPQQTAGLPSRAGRPEGVWAGGPPSGASHPPHSQLSAPAPSRPIFQGGRAHLPGSVNSSALPSLCRQSADTPCHRGLDCLVTMEGTLNKGGRREVNH